MHKPPLPPNADEVARVFREKGIKYAIQMWAARDTGDVKLVASNTTNLIADADAITDYITNGKKSHPK